MIPRQPFVFGYFPRNKYKDLVFYVKTGEYSNMKLFEMENTEENRALMDALVLHTTRQSGRDKIMDEKSCSYLVYQIRVKNGKEGYSCTSEEDTAGSCCRNGRCVFKDGES